MRRRRIVDAAGREPRFVWPVAFVLLLTVASSLISLVLGLAMGGLRLLADAGELVQVGTAVAFVVFVGWVAWRLLDRDPVALTPARIVVTLLLLDQLVGVFASWGVEDAWTIPLVYAGLYAALLAALLRMRAG